MAGATKLSPEAVLILLSLADGSKHGYAIQQDIAAVTGRSLGPGSLYGALARLEALGYILPSETEGSRRPYSLTAAGLTALSNAVESMRRVTDAAVRRLATR